MVESNGMASTACSPGSAVNSSISGLHTTGGGGNPASCASIFSSICSSLPASPSYNSSPGYPTYIKSSHKPKSLIKNSQNGVSSSVSSTIFSSNSTSAYTLSTSDSSLPKSTVSTTNSSPSTVRTSTLNLPIQSPNNSTTDALCGLNSSNAQQNSKEQTNALSPQAPTTCHLSKSQRWVRPLGYAERFMTKAHDFGCLTTVYSLWLESRTPIQFETIKKTAQIMYR